MTTSTTTAHQAGAQAPSCDRTTAVTRSLLGYGVIAGPVYVAVSLAQALLWRGLAELDRVHTLDSPAGPYVVQAEIAACHARATSVEETRWDQIAAWYAVLGHLWPSPVVELNRAIAVGMADAPAAGLAVLDELAGSGRLAGYPQLPAARADMLTRLGRVAEARTEYEKAAALSKNDRERQLFARRALAGRTSAPVRD